MIPQFFVQECLSFLFQTKNLNYFYWLEKGIFNKVINAKKEVHNCDNSFDGLRLKWKAVCTVGKLRTWNISLRRPGFESSWQHT
jgi:hypothetical protein